MKASIVAVSILAAASSVVAGAGHRKRINHSYGTLTWFNVDKNPDKCGQIITDNAAAVRVPKAMWKNGENCGQWMEITIRGQKQYAMCTGYCELCQGNDIDVTQSMFTSFDKLRLDDGVSPIDNWKFMSKKWQPSDMDECD